MNKLFHTKSPMYFENEKFVFFSTQNKKLHKGFTLIEMLVVIAIIGLFASVMIVAINPPRQLAKARDTQRKTDIYTLVSAIYQYASEHSGALPDTDGSPLTSNFPTSYRCIGTSASCFNLAGAGVTGDTIVPVYIVTMPMDPRTGTASNTGYSVYVDTNNHIHASATGEVETLIEVVK